MNGAWVIRALTAITVVGIGGRAGVRLVHRRERD